MYSTQWLVRQPGGFRRFRLYCFSYAGGNASTFIPWQAALDPSIEICAVQLPGRGARIKEHPYKSLPVLIKALGQVIEQESNLPFAFFGHSLGGLIAFELARYCKHHYLPTPSHLFMSGCDAPQYRTPSLRLHELEDDDLINSLRDYNGAPPEVLEQRELMELMLPTIRADFALAADYQYRTGPLLNIPITVMSGKLDKHVSLDYVGQWQRETTNTCNIHWFEGDHFFIQSERSMLLDRLNAELSDDTNC